jgi:hypothetical protein
MDLSVKLSRSLLSLADLEINDHLDYYVSDLGDTQVTWNKQTVRSPYVDGEITVQRSKQNVTRNMKVEVLGTNLADARANAKVLAQAVSQDTFTLTVDFGSDPTVYLCEASDYSWVESKERFHAGRGILAVTLIHKPTPVSGAI